MIKFNELEQEIQIGLDGRNEGIPMGFERLNRYIGIRKKMYFLFGGLTGSGKTSIIDDAFVLNPYDWYKSKANESNIELEIIYWSMERSKLYKIAKWTVRRIFMDHGEIIPLGRLLGWRGFKKLTHDEHDLVLSYKDYINEMSDTITIIDGPDNPIGISKFIREHALKNGVIEEVDEYNKVFIPHNENKITLGILDHLGKTKLTKEYNTKKKAIDKLSDEISYARDLYGYSFAAVSQFNRDLSNPIRLKNGDVEPQLEDFKESGQTQDDADAVIALFDPLRYKVDDPSGYELEKLKDEFGAKYFRSLRILKNTYGEEDIRIGLAFLGQVGMFKELPRKSKITDEDYESVVNKTYFFNEPF